MKHKTLITTAAFAIAAMTSAFAGGEGWLTDMDAAKTQAAKEKKDLLLDFTGSDWCGWCIKLNKEVFSEESFKSGVKDKFLLVELDFPQKKQLEPKLKEQNEKLRDQMGIQGFPTIMLCDATGKPYAKTGYQPGGRELYLKHLDELQASRVKRDAAFAAADKAKDDAEKAKLLVEGLKALDEEIVDSCYGDVVEKIGQLDKEDKTGFVKERKEAIVKKEAAAKKEAEEMKAMQKVQGKVQEFFGGKIQPLMEAKEFDKALTEVKAFIKENQDIPEGMQVMMVFNIGLAGPITNGDTEAAMDYIDEMVKTYPNSQIASSVDAVKSSIKSRIAQMKKDKEAAKDAPKEDAHDAPKEDAPKKVVPKTETK